MKTVERRLKLLEKEGEGLSTLEIVKELSVEFQCSRRTLYSDFQNRSTWQPQIQQLANKKDVALKVLNRYEQIYRLTYKKFLLSSNESCQVAFLKLLVYINSKICETAVLPDLLIRLDKVEELSQAENEAREAISTTMGWRQDSGYRVAIANIKKKMGEP